MILAECAVVATLVVVAWHLVATASVPDFPVPLDVAPPAEAGDAGGPVPAVATAPPEAAPTLLPGLNVDPSFWRVRLAELNDGEAEFERLEWRLVHSAMDAAHRYVESVVLPSIARAERPRG
jgi:hypothetical protein